MIELSKNQKIILAVVGCIILFVIGYYITSQTGEEEYINIDEENEIVDEEIDEEEIIVHITGAVNNPGIVKTKEGARIADIIELAGGELESADTSEINLAYKVQDGEKIYIPTKGENKENLIYITTEAGNNPISKSDDNKKVNINTASQEELDTLQGIGPSTATKIIEYREKNGKFKTIEEIKNVTGIGDSKFEAIKENISV